jgi:hypothetical protein
MFFTSFLHVEVEGRPDRYGGVPIPVSRLMGSRDRSQCADAYSFS